MSEGNLFRAFDVSAAGLSAQRARLNVVSTNLANARTTRTAEGGPYRRRVVSMEAQAPGSGPELFERLLEANRQLGMSIEKTDARHVDDAPIPTFADSAEGVAWTVTEDRNTPTRLEFEPGHPDANAEGYVEYPNVEVISEMTELVAASRAYEANVTVLNATKTMLKKALEI